ncbi:hypothetical protein L0657_08845 [Dyadobacter sp. CY345]|uniref:hypothetical protein n=1 Tax=Dyadobacter sp. CY345 TaxID=2909335 RepID=UPI001F47E7FA|nr:hypothetical protein [Dyadobacter sp. CY345]MCF2444061.1 hypothetical protein [Dyadobacter sp. CY345]
MTDFTISTAEEIIEKRPVRSYKYYAVYDCCVTNHVPSWDLAFIEERLCDSTVRENVTGDEKHFPSLREAKIYAKINFNSGAEYFSLNQINSPDNIFYIILDKIRYLLA